MSSPAGGSLEVLAESYSLRLEELSQCCKLHGTENTASARRVLQNVVEEVAAIEQLLSTYGQQVEEEAKRLEEAKSLCSTAREISARLAHMSTNWPARMSGHRVDSGRSSTSSSPPRPFAESSAELSGVSLASSQQPSTRKSVSAAGTSSLPPRIAYLTLDEFNQVPKYIRGRLAYDQANMAIDELHKAYTAKYTLLHTPRSQLSDACVKRCKGYKLQQTEDTKGGADKLPTHRPEIGNKPNVPLKTFKFSQRCYFVTDHDIKTDCNLKLDTTGRTALLVLRHCSRLKEVHGGGFVRFVLRT